ncbi:MAG: cytochrome P450 [Nocardioides sp.]|nr:cytochrome P450 [Nocardioides sp.]
MATTVRPPKAVKAGIRAVTKDAKAFLHWGFAHGLPSLMLRGMAGRGDLQARMVRTRGGDPSQVNDLVEEIRGHGPLYRSQMGYVATSHAAVREVLTSGDFRTGFPGRAGMIGRVVERTAPTTIHPVEPPSLLVTEPPDHTRYRKLVTRVFTMRAVQRLRERTEEIASGLLDDLEHTATGPVDLVETYSSLLPVTVIAEILGVPDEERERVLEFGAAAAPSLDLGLGWRNYREVDGALAAFDGWLSRHLDNLRRNPGDNLLSQLVAARDEGEGLNDVELKSTAGLVLAAGFETTVNLLSNGIRLLHDHPDQLARLRADPDLWPNAVEEVLRVDPPVLLTGRMALRDTEVTGVRVRGGAMITTILSGANRDPEIFEDPERFDVARENARDHLSFSAGRHHCLGAALARMEGEVGLRTVFDRFPDLRLTPGARRRTTRILRGYEVLPAVMRP